MKAAQLIAPRKWTMLDLERPAAMNGNMLVRMERVAICGTDKPFFCGTYPSYPLEPGHTGHEGLGVVEDCPSGAYQTGDRIILAGFQQGLFQEYVLANDRDSVRVPHGFDPDIVLMSQLLGTVIHCFFKLGNVINKDVVVLGQGPVGQLFNATLRNLGARTIIGVDPLRHRLEVGRQMGATHTVDPGRESLLDVVEGVTGGRLADLTIEAVGEEETLTTCSSITRRNGTIVYFGVPDKVNHEGVMQVRFQDLFKKELCLITTVGPNPHEDYATALDWITQDRIDVRPILTHFLPFEQIQQAFEIAFDEAAAQESVKVVLRF